MPRNRWIAFRLERLQFDPLAFDAMPPEEFWAILRREGVDVLVRWLVFPATVVSPPGHLEVYLLCRLPKGCEGGSFRHDLACLVSGATSAHRVVPVWSRPETRFALAPFGSIAWSLALGPETTASPFGFQAAGSHPEVCFQRETMDLGRALFILATSEVATALDWRVFSDRSAADGPIGVRIRWTGSAGEPPTLAGTALARALGFPKGRFLSDEGQGPVRVRPGDFPIPLPTAQTAAAMAPELRPPACERLPAGRLPGTGAMLGLTVDGRPVRVAPEDRLRHEWIVGQTGTGKSTLILNRVLADLQAGEGLAVLDPHGPLVDAILERVPAHRRDDLIVVDSSRRGADVPAMNLLECSDIEQAHARAGQILEMFTTLWPKEMCGPIFLQATTNALVLLAARFEQPGTLADLPRLFMDSQFRKDFIASFPAKERVPEALAWWKDVFEHYSVQSKSDSLDYFISKFHLFFSDPLLRRVLGRSRSTFDLRGAMENRRVLLCNLSRSEANPLASTMLTWVFLQGILNAALARGPRRAGGRPAFYVYCDEFQRLAGPSTSAILSEVRKYDVGLVLAHQFVDQLPEETLASVLGNVGTKVIFRVGPRDAARISGYQPDLSVTDLIRLPNFTAFVEVLANGVPMAPFTLKTLPPPAP